MAHQLILLGPIPVPGARPSAGVDTVAKALLLGFLHHHEEVEYFGTHVLPIIRRQEAELREPIGAAR